MEQRTEQIYALIVATPHVSAADLVSVSGEPREQVEADLQVLISLGLVQESQVVPEGWRAVSPALVLGQRITEQEQGVAQALDALTEQRSLLARLQPVFATRPDDRDVISHLPDRDAVLMRIGDRMR